MILQEAPKRAMSAFLYYSQLMRPQVKSEHREMRSTGETLIEVVVSFWTEAIVNVVW